MRCVEEGVTAIMDTLGTGRDSSNTVRDGDVVTNPRYIGQSAGIHSTGYDGRGPAEESRYGATPLGAGNVRNDQISGAQPSYTGQTTSGAWPTPVAPPNAHRSDLVGQGRGLDSHSREGMVENRMHNVGTGPNSGTNQDAYGASGYGESRKEGVMHRMADAMGMGPHAGAHHTSGAQHAVLGYNPNENHPSSNMGFGGGLGHPTNTTAGIDQSHGLGSHAVTGTHDGHQLGNGQVPPGILGERRVEPGYDASQGQMGSNYHGVQGTEGNYDASNTGAYPESHTGRINPNSTMGDTGLDRYTPAYSHHDMTDTGLGHHSHPGSNTGYSYETKTDSVDGYPQNTMGSGTGLGHQSDISGHPHETLGNRMEETVGGRRHDYNERVGKSFEDTSYDEKLSGFDGTRTNAGAGEHDVTKTGAVGYGATRTGDASVYDATNVDHAHRHADADVSGTQQPEKKGFVGKIKDMIHH